jgi:hypothetical protein
MVQGVSSGGHVGVIALTAVRYAQSDAGQIVLPVRPAQLINANFRHIQLRPDSRLEDGIPLYKLRILDSLIDQLSRVAGGSSQPLTSADAGSIDSLLAGMSREIRSAGASPYRGGFFPEPGALVDLVA